MRYVYSRFGDYEWYLIVDDDAYINMENMMEFLKNRNSSAPVTYGHAFRIKVKGGFHSGGCGYVLTGEAFRRISNKLVSNRTFCQNTGFWDDVDLAACLRTLDVYINSSLDELGRERFIPVNFLSMYIGPVPKWLFSFSVRPPQLVCLFL
jgi:glycoprotein-N-acetylgalactosamine 3-beta-galactosyltransferase